MMRCSRLISRCIAGGAGWLPLLAVGHGAEFLDARFEARHGELRLRIIADYGDNPMIADEAEAKMILSDALRIELGPSDIGLRLDELAPVTIMPCVDRDARSPMPRTEAGSAAHRLLAASWRWSAPDGVVRFLVPATSRQTVLFWIDEPGDSPPRWSMLVPGDRTPDIAVRRPWWRKPLVWGGVAGVLLLASGVTWRFVPLGRTARW